MLASRAASRFTLRSLRPARYQARFVSTEAKTGVASGFASGVAGGTLVFVAGYTYYYFSGAKSIVNAVSQVNKSLKTATDSFQENAPESSEAIKWMRDITTSYVAIIPGARSYVESAFDDLEAVQQKYGQEVDTIFNEAYEELKNITKTGATMEAAVRIWGMVQRMTNKLGDLAEESMDEILDNHPQIKERVGENLNDLKSMVDSCGPEAKKELEKTYKQISDIFKRGLSVDSVGEVKQVIDNTTGRINKLGEAAWKKGVEQAQPYLDKNPEIKKALEQNAEKLKRGNISELMQRVKQASDSGNLDDLTHYIDGATHKFKETGGSASLESFVHMIPAGGNILEHLKQLQDVATHRGSDAEVIVQKAFDDVVAVLQKRISEIEELAEKGAKETKN